MWITDYRILFLDCILWYFGDGEKIPEDINYEDKKIIFLLVEINRFQAVSRTGLDTRCTVTVRSMTRRVYFAVWNASKHLYILPQSAMYDKLLSGYCFTNDEYN